MKTTLSQKEAILKHLIKGKKITPIDALNKFGCFRLSARIADLRNEGFKIKTEIKKGKKNYAVYSLVKEK